MELARVIEVLRNDKCCGTGYLLTPRHVLTARHVVKPEAVGTPCAIRPLLGADPSGWGQGEDRRPSARPAEVAWVSARHDFALLRLTDQEPAIRGASAVPFGVIPVDGAHHRFESSGFPTAAGIDQRSIRGSLTWVLTEPRRFDVDVDNAKPADWTKWAGFSGAAVFARNLLVGVVRTVDGHWSGGKLEATPASWLFDEPEFRAYCDRAGVPVAAPLYAGEIDHVVPLESGDHPEEISSLRRFSHYNPRIPFLGRVDALRQLHAFLTCDTGRPFAWWMVTGVGGAGKTRLARHLCRNMPEAGWRVGFLPQQFRAEAALEAWTPRAPTLIIADYVMVNIEQVKTLADRLARRQAPPKLRLLLLERETSALFESHFLGSRDDGRVWIEQARYTPPPKIAGDVQDEAQEAGQDDPAPAASRKLSGKASEKADGRLRPLHLDTMTEDDLWALVEACPWQPEPVPLPIGRAQFFERLDRLDRERRPLVAMMLADALASSSDFSTSGDLQALLRDRLERDREHLWPPSIATADAAIGTTDADISIAFATMIGGMGLPELTLLESALEREIDPNTLAACAVAVGKPLSEEVRLEKLEPDLLGEFFVLEALGKDPKNGFVKKPSWMPEVAWRTNGQAVFDFVARAGQTFAGHRAMEQIEITVEGVHQSWFLAALHHIANIPPAAGFEVAQSWLGAHAPRDVGAARALAQLVAAAARAKPAIFTVSSLLRATRTLSALDGTLPGDGTLHEEVASALLNGGITLGEQGHSEAAIAVYDDLLDRFGNAHEPALREEVARALVNKGGRLGTLGHSEAAIAVYDDLLHRFGDAQEPALREQVARALVSKAITLGTLGHSEAAIAVYDDLLNRFGDAQEPALREQVARALVSKAITLGTLGHSEAAIAVYDDLLHRFSDAQERARHRLVARALVNKGLTLGTLGRSEAAIAVYDDLLDRFGDAHEPALREEVARALVNKGITLGTLGRSEAAIAVYDDLLDHFGDAREPALREMVAHALVIKGFTLGYQGHSDAAIAVYDDLLDRFGDAHEPALRELVAKGLGAKGITLGDQGHSEAAIAVYDDLLDRFGDAREPALRDEVARALVSKGTTLGDQGHSEAAIAVFDDLLDRFSDAHEPALRERVAGALVNKGITHGTLGRSEAATAVYDDLLDRFGDAHEPALREFVARGLVAKGITLEQGHIEAAIAVYDDLLDRFGDAREPAMREIVEWARSEVGRLREDSTS